MKLLITTQKIDKNDNVLGFFHSWVLEFAKYFEEITIICLGKGEYNFPDNIRVLSLGKEEYSSYNSRAVFRFKSLYRFYKYIWKERKNYDSVFVHMNPEYVVLGGWFWRIMDKKIGLWYVHKQSNWRLKLAEKLANKIFSVSAKTFPFMSKKLYPLGHGIDTEKFRCNSRKIPGANEEIRIISAGRITKIKNLDILIKAAKIIKNKISDKFIIDIIGAPVTKEDNNYQSTLQDLVKNENIGEIIKFSGAVPYNQMNEIYCRSHIFVNLCQTGGVDKAVLEAMSCEMPVVVSNESFAPYFENLAEKFTFKYRDENDLANKIAGLVENYDESYRKFLREQVEKHHNLEILIKKIADEISHG